MRPGQQNPNNKNRSRGRNNNNNNNNGGRKHLNPLSRNFESNGPDVKVRGTAAHIAEKYVQLARDAQTSGDSVMAENYFQHAEHYFRIISAAQPQGQRLDQYGQDMEEGDDEGEEIVDSLEQHARIPEDLQRDDRNQRDDRPMRDDRRQRDRNERQPRLDRPAFVEAIVGEVPVVPVEAEVVDAPVEASDSNADDADARRPRRPRRRPRAALEGGDDPANAPQPDLGELPAFITAGGTPTAAE